MLNNLGRKILKGFDAGLEDLVSVADLDLFVAGDLPGALQGEAALFGFVGSLPFQDFRVVHKKIFSSVVHGNDPHCLSDHIGSHANAAFLIGFQGVQQVRANGAVLDLGRAGRSA